MAKLEAPFLHKKVVLPIVEYTTPEGDRNIIPLSLSLVGLEDVKGLEWVGKATTAQTAPPPAPKKAPAPKTQTPQPKQETPKLEKPKEQPKPEEHKIEKETPKPQETEESPFEGLGQSPAAQDQPKPKEDFDWASLIPEEEAEQKPQEAPTAQVPPTAQPAQAPAPQQQTQTPTAQPAQAPTAEPAKPKSKDEKQQESVQKQEEWNKVVEDPEVRKSIEDNGKIQTMKVTPEQAKEHIQWGGQYAPIQKQIVDAENGGEGFIKPEQAGYVSRFVGMLMNPVIGTLDYVNQLLDATQIPKNPTGVSNAIKDHLDGMNPNSPGINSVVAMLVGGLFGTDLLRMANAMKGKNKQGPKLWATEGHNQGELQKLNEALDLTTSREQLNFVKDLFKDSDTRLSDAMIQEALHDPDKMENLIRQGLENFKGANGLKDASDEEVLKKVRDSFWKKNKKTKTGEEGNRGPTQLAPGTQGGEKPTMYQPGSEGGQKPTAIAGETPSGAAGTQLGGNQETKIGRENKETQLIGEEGKPELSKDEDARKKRMLHKLVTDEIRGSGLLDRKHTQRAIQHFDGAFNAKLNEELPQEEVDQFGEESVRKQRFKEALQAGRDAMIDYRDSLWKGKPKKGEGTKPTMLGSEDRKTKVRHFDELLKNAPEGTNLQKLGGSILKSAIPEKGKAKEVLNGYNQEVKTRKELGATEEKAVVDALNKVVLDRLKLYGLSKEEVEKALDKKAASILELEEEPQKVEEPVKLEEKKEKLDPKTAPRDKNGNIMWTGEQWGQYYDQRTEEQEAKKEGYEKDFRKQLKEFPGMTDDKLSEVMDLYNEIYDVTYDSDPEVIGYDPAEERKAPWIAFGSTEGTTNKNSKGRDVRARRAAEEAAKNYLNNPAGLAQGWESAGEKIEHQGRGIPELRTEKHQKAFDKAKEAIDKAEHLSPEQKEKYSNSVKQVISQFPEKALERYDTHTKGYKFYESTEKLTEEWAKMDERAAKILEQGRSIGGVYEHRGQDIHVDGDYSFTGYGVAEGGESDSSMVYAHEFTHAIDGPGFGLSKSDAWKEAWQAEMVDAFKKDPGNGGLTKYATTEPREGFAEFGRLLYATNTPLTDIEARFPKAAQFFKDHGLWPEQEESPLAVAEEEKAKYQLPKEVKVPKGAKLDIRTKEYEEEIKEFFGGSYDQEALKAAANGVEWANIKVNPSVAGDSVRTTFKDEGVKATRYFKRNEDGDLYVDNDSFDIDDTSKYKGKGYELFINQVNALRKMGVKYIQTLAAYGSDFNGYYTWPRLGYDGTIPEEVFDREEKTGLPKGWALKPMPPEIREVLGASNRILDLFAIPGGKEWWKENGAAIEDAKFDLSDGSRSMQVLQAYYQERKQREAEENSSPFAESLDKVTPEVKKPKIQYKSTEAAPNDEARKELLSSVFNTDLDEGTVGALTNGVDGSVALVEIPFKRQIQKYFPPLSTNHVQISSSTTTGKRDGEVNSSRTFYRDADGRLMVRNNYFGIGKDSPYKGKGFELACNQIYALKAAGVQRIETEAAGSVGDSDFNGWFTWPRMGFGGTIEEDTYLAIPDNLKKQMGDSRDILDLMKTPEGVEWWRGNGSAIEDAYFDLSDGSRNMQAFEKYLKERKEREAKPKTKSLPIRLRKSPFSVGVR